MPFQSKAQRRKFYALKERGQMSQKKIDEWESKTPSKIPERKKKVAMEKAAYTEGGLRALDKLGLSAEDFQEFVQNDDTAATTSKENENFEEEETGRNSQERLLRAPSPWSGAVHLTQSEPVDF